MQIDRGMVVTIEKESQSAAMVVMSMRNDGHVHIPEIETQLLGVVPEDVGLAHVEEQVLPIVQLDMQAQTMFNGQTVGGGVFYE